MLLLRAKQGIFAHASTRLQLLHLREELSHLLLQLDLREIELVKVSVHDGKAGDPLPRTRMQLLPERKEGLGQTHA